MTVQAKLYECVLLFLCPVFKSEFEHVSVSDG